MDEIAVNRFLAEQDIFVLFYTQLKKDFEGAGVGAGILQGIESDPVRVRDVVLSAVQDVSRHNSQQLPSLLYRIDISEKKLRDFSRKNGHLSFEEIVSELIIRRILQKVVLKNRFSNG